MHRHYSGWAFLVGAWLGASAWWSASLADAASIDLQLEYVESYDASLTPLGQTLDLPCPLCGDGDYYKFNVWMQLDDLEPNEDFAYVSFNVGLAGGGFVPASFLGSGPWVANNPVVDFNGPSPPAGAPLFAENHDLGFDGEDLMEITVSGDAATMALAQLGETGQHPAVGGGPPFLLGEFWLQTTGTNSITPFGLIELLPNVSTTQAWGTYVDGMLTPQAAQGIHGDEIVWICPEPASGMLAGLAAIGLLGLVRRR